MKHVLFATVAAFGLAASVSAFAMASNDRIMTNSTLPQGITLAHDTAIADSAGGGESRNHNGSLTVADSAGGGESRNHNGNGSLA